MQLIFFFQIYNFNLQTLQHHKAAEGINCNIFKYILQRLHCKYLQSNGSGSALENLPFGWKYSSLTAILLQVLHCTSCEQKLLLLQVFQCFCLCRKLTQILQGKAVHFTSKHTLFLLRRETILLATIIGRMDNFMIVIWWQGKKLAGWEF